nr:MAG TPA: hypothetical protein [Caudoviricetes sp.]
MTRIAMDWRCNGQRRHAEEKHRLDTQRQATALE